MRTQDALGNISADYSDTIILDTTAPDAPTCTASQDFSTPTIAVSCTATDGTITYTTDGSTPTCSSSTRSNQSFSSTTTIKVGQCDTAGNFSTTPNSYTYTYVPDTTPPTVINVTSTKPHGSYTSGDIIDISVQFDE